MSSSPDETASSGQSPAPTDVRLAQAVPANPFDILRQGPLAPLHASPPLQSEPPPTYEQLGNPLHMRSGTHPMPNNPDALGNSEFIQRAIVKPAQQSFALLVSITGTPEQWKEAGDALRDALSGKPLTREQIERGNEQLITREKVDASHRAIVQTGQIVAGILVDFAKDPQSEWNKTADIIAKDDPALGATLRKIGDGKPLNGKDYEILAGELAGQLLPDLVVDGAIRGAGRLGRGAGRGVDLDLPDNTVRTQAPDHVQTVNLRPDPNNPGSYVPDFPDAPRPRPGALDQQTVNLRPDPNNPGNYVPDYPDVPRGRPQAPDQPGAITRAMGADGALGEHLNRELGQWASRGGKIEHLSNSPGVLYGSTRDNAGLLGEALIDAAKVPADQRKAAHAVLAGVRDNMTDRSGQALADMYESMLPGKPNHAEFMKRVAAQDQALDAAEAAARRQTPDGRQTLPVQEQASLMVKGFQVDGPLAPRLEREIAEWAQGRPKNAIENLYNSGTELFGDGTVTAQRKRMNGVAGEALAETVATPTNRRAVDQVISEIRAESAAAGADGRTLMATYEDIAKPGTRNRQVFDERVEARQEQLRRETPEGRQTLPAGEQAALLTRGYGVEGPLAAPLQREIVEWAQGRPKNAIENLASSGVELFGDGQVGAQRPRMNGVAGEALADAVATPANRKAVEQVIGEIRQETAAAGGDGRTLMQRFEAIATPGSDARNAFDARVAERQSLLEAQARTPPALAPAAPDAPDVGIRVQGQTTGAISISAPANTSIGVDIRDSTTGPVQTISGSGNVQVSGGRDALQSAATAIPDRNGNVQTSEQPGLGIVLNRPGDSGNTGTRVQIDNSTVNGGVQSIVGDNNVQIATGDARILGDRRQTVNGGDGNVQTQNLGANVTADSVTQTIDGRSDSRQQIGNKVEPPLGHVSVTDSVSWLQGNQNSVVQGNRNDIQIGAGNATVVNGVRIDPLTVETADPQRVDARLSGGVQNNSTVHGSVSAVHGHQNVVVEGNGNTVRIGVEPSAQERSAIYDPIANGRQTLLEDGDSSHLRGQKVAYTPRFSTQHALTGEGAGAYTTISGHGILENDKVLGVIGNSVQRDSFVVPEGVNLHFLGLPGGVITDRLGQRADVGGDLTGVPLLKLGAGDTAPDILITPSFGTINIKGNPITVDNPQGVRLSQLIRDHDLSGNIVVSSCLQQSIADLNREKWHGITFDLPDRYPKPQPPDLSGQPPRLPIDPNFNTQHGLTNSGEGTYTPIGGNVGLSGTNPATFRPFQEQNFTVPEGVTVYFSALPGGSVHNRLAEAIEKGEDLSRIPLLKAGAGSVAPDPLLLPGTYSVDGDFLRINNREGQRLSEVIKEHGLTGNVVLAGGLPGRDRPHSNVMFDLPEHYPQRNAPGGTRNFELLPEQTLAPALRSAAPDADAAGQVVAKTPEQRNLLQRAWDKALDAQLPSVANLTVFASQSGPDSKWQAGIPVDAGAMVQKLQEYMANNVKGDSQASVDDFFKTIDPKRAGDVKVGSSGLVGGVDFASGLQRLQTLQVAIDGANVNGGGLRWDEKAEAYQLKATAVDGGYRLDGPLTVKPSESLTPLNISGSRLSGEAGEALGLPSMGLKITDDYKPITLPAGTLLTQDNLDVINRALADPEYRSRAGTTDYGATAKANVALSEPRGDSSDPANLFNRVFAHGEAGEFGKLEPAARKLEASVSPGVLGIDIHNPPLNSTRVGFEVETRPGPSVRELFEAGQRMIQGGGQERTGHDLRSERTEPSSPVATTPAAPDARAMALLADSRSALEEMNRRVGVNPPPQVTETLVPQIAQQAYAAGFNEVARTDLNLATRQRDGSEIAAGTQLIASDGSERRVVLNIAEALQKTPEQAQSGLVAQVAAANVQPNALARDPAVAATQEPERQTAGTMRIG